MRAQGSYSDGSTADISQSVVWSSGNVGAATVSHEGADLTPALITGYITDLGLPLLPRHPLVISSAEFGKELGVGAAGCSYYRINITQAQPFPLSFRDVTDVVNITLLTNGKIYRFDSFSTADKTVTVEFAGKPLDITYCAGDSPSLYYGSTARITVP